MKQLTNQKIITHFAEHFGEHLKFLRTEQKISQKQMAEYMEVPISTYANWKQGRREPSIYDLYCLCWVLKISPNELFDYYGKNNDD